MTPTSPARSTDADALSQSILPFYRSGITLNEFLRETRKRFLLLALAESGHNICRAARRLGMHRNTLSRQLEELKLAAQVRQSRRARPRKQPQRATASAATHSFPTRQEQRA